MSSAHAGPAPTLLRGPLRRVDPAIKVVGLVVFLLVVGLTPNDRLGVLAVWLGVAAVAATAALADWRTLSRRLVLDLPVAALAVAQAVFGPSPTVEVLGLDLSRPGLEAGAALLLKATTGIVAVSAVVASTTVPELLGGLRRLGFPAWFTEMVGLSIRQVSVLQDELRRIHLAASLRRPSATRRATWDVATRSLGAELVRATERADRLRLAADLRGGGDG